MNRSVQAAPRWDGLSVIEQGLLARAAAEGVLHEVGTGRAGPSGRRPAHELNAILTAVAGLVSHDLIGLYRVADGYPDLSRTEITGALRACRSGVPDEPAIGMYLTPRGEDLMGSALTGLVPELRFEPDWRRSG